MRFLFLFCTALPLTGCFAAKPKRVEARDSLTAAQYLIEDMGVAEKVRALVPTISAMVEQQLVALWPECAGEAKELKGIVEAAVEPTIAEVTRNAAQSYARRFSLDELKAIDAYETGTKDEATEAAFKATRVGARYFAQRRLIADEARETTRRWTMQSSQRVYEDLQKRGHSVCAG